VTNELWTTATGVLLTVAGVVGAFGVGLVGAIALFFMFLGLLAVSLSVNVALFSPLWMCVNECVVVGNIPLVPSDT